MWCSATRIRDNDKSSNNNTCQWTYVYYLFDSDLLRRFKSLSRPSSTEIPMPTTMIQMGNMLYTINRCVYYRVFSSRALCLSLSLYLWGMDAGESAAVYRLLTD